MRYDGRKFRKGAGRWSINRSYGKKIIETEKKADAPQTDDAEMVPAPGAVVEEMNQVKIVYGENTYFQISHSTMTGITLEDCRKEEVKKQSMLYLYGDYQEDGTFLAKRVIIDRFEKEGEWE